MVKCGKYIESICMVKCGKYIESGGAQTTTPMCLREQCEVGRFSMFKFAGRSIGWTLQHRVDTTA